MHALRTLVLALALLTLGGVAHAGTCEQRSPAVFVLRGATDQAMADCVAAKLKPTTTELVVDSEGGNVNTAMDIAEQLSALNDLTIRIDGQCSSSCGNYFLPMGRTLLVGKLAIINLHGGIDAGVILKAAPQDRPRLQATAARQIAFARKHGIPPGWLFYHTAAAPTRVDALDGAFRWKLSPDDKYYLAETPMLRSCLPGLDVSAYDAWLKTQMTVDRLARLKKNGVVPTGTIVCNGQGW